MPVKIGIDIGSSTTKIVAFEGKHMLPPMAVKADSQVASLYGAFGRYLYLRTVLDHAEHRRHP